MPTCALSPRSWTRALALHSCFQQMPPDRVIRWRGAREMPAVLVELGELAGVIYRSRRGGAETPRTFVHFFDRSPMLAADPEGRRLFILGGRYRVTRRGIEG